MANSNFVVRNGLEVGSAIIFAGNGDISTGGNITITGSGTGPASSSIVKNDSSIVINDTGSGSSIVVTVDGTAIQTLNTNGINVNYGNLLVSNITVSTSTTSGALVVLGGVGVNGELYIANTGDVSANIGAYQTFANANVVAIQANIGAFYNYANTKIGTNTNSNLVITSTTGSTSSTTGALVVLGGVGIGGNINIGGSGGNSVVATGNIAVVGNILPFGANITYNLGSTTQWWNTFYGVSTQARYADLAENYLADQPYSAGTVLEFGGENEVTVAMTEASKRVAGIVSSNPAHLMNGGLRGSTVVALALVGRVPCNVIGPVYKGDMMISAGYGYARASANPATGTIIGKALQNFEGEKGMIEVVVGRV